MDHNISFCKGNPTYNDTIYSKTILNNESVMQLLLMKGMRTGEDFSKLSFLYAVSLGVFTKSERERERTPFKTSTITFRVLQDML